MSVSTPSRCWVEIRTFSISIGTPVLVADRDLGLAVGAQVGHDLALAHLGEPVGELVGERDRHRHQLRRLAGRVAEHHPLVAGAGDVELVVVGGVGARLERLVDALGDVGRLLVDRVDHRARVGREAEVGVGVADLADRLAGDLRDVDVGLGRDLAGDDDEAGVDQRLAGDAAVRVVGEDRVEDAVGDLVGDLVGMALGHRLGGEQVLVVAQGLGLSHGAERLDGRRRARISRRWSATGPSPRPPAPAPSSSRASVASTSSSVLTASPSASSRRNSPANGGVDRVLGQARLLAGRRPARRGRGRHAARPRPGSPSVASLVERRARRGRPRLRRRRRSRPGRWRRGEPVEDRVGELDRRREPEAAASPHPRPRSWPKSGSLQSPATRRPAALSAHATRPSSSTPSARNSRYGSAGQRLAGAAGGRLERDRRLVAERADQLAPRGRRSPSRRSESDQVLEAAAIPGAWALACESSAAIVSAGSPIAEVGERRGPQPLGQVGLERREGGEEAGESVAARGRARCGPRARARRLAALSDAATPAARPRRRPAAPASRAPRRCPRPASSIPSAESQASAKRWSGSRSRISVAAALSASDSAPSAPVAVAITAWTPSSVPITRKPADLRGGHVALIDAHLDPLVLRGLDLADGDRGRVLAARRRRRRPRTARLARGGPVLGASTATAASSPNQGSIRVEFQRLAAGARDQPQGPVGELAAQRRQLLTDVRGGRELVRLRVEVGVQVGERVGGDQLLGVVGGRAGVAAGELAGQVRDHRPEQDQQQRRRAHRGDQAAAGDQRERAPEAPRAAPGRDREREQVAPDVGERPPDEPEQVADGVANGAQPLHDRGRDPSRGRLAH